MKLKIIPIIAGLGAGALATGALASSHREAPAIAEDQYADNTDVYSSGPNFYKFSDEARYDIHVDNDGDAIPDVTYRYTFHTTVKNGGTFLYNVGPVSSINDPNLNVIQTYNLDRIDDKTSHHTHLLVNAPVAPWNVGKRSFPSYEPVALQAVSQSSGHNAGTTSFAGPRDEPFFVDLHVFDLLGVGGAPTTDGVNVMSLVLEVPITDVAAKGVRPAAGNTGPTSVVGIYANASRPEVRILRKYHPNDDYGVYIQVSRLGWPLVNEVIIPLKDKDKYNHTDPKDDVSNFGAYILDPEVPKLLNAVLGAGCPATPPGGRLDIVGLLAPNGTTPADLLRINITQGQSHFPNGRALTDDVTDTLLTVACNNGGAIGDGVNANDKPFTTTFPYLASPASGNP